MADPPTNNGPPIASELIRNGVALTVLVLAMIGLFWWVHRTGELRPERIVERIRSTEPYDDVVYFLGCGIGTVLCVPDTLFNIVGAILFGPFRGTFLCWLALGVGSIGSYFAARALGANLVDKILGENKGRFDQILHRHGFGGLVIIRMIPVLPFAGVSLACGLARVHLGRYLAATLIGSLPIIFLHQFLFYKFGEAFLDKGTVWIHLATQHFVLGSLVVGVLLTLLALAHRRRFI